METRRTNQFLKVALGTRSPARQKLFKGKFHDLVINETKLPFNISNMASDIKPKTSGAPRRELAPLSRGNHTINRAEHSEGRAQTTKEDRRGASVDANHNEMADRVVYNDQHHRLQRPIRA